MSKKERIKTEIDVLKALILAFLTAIFGVFGFALMKLPNNQSFARDRDCIGGIVSLWCIICACKKSDYKINLRRWNDRNGC